MREEEAFVAVVGIVASAILLATWIKARVKAREGRQKLLELALQHQTLDDATKRELLGRITGRSIFGFGQRTWAAVGWIGMFVGIGCMASGDRDGEQAGPIVALISFGVLSLPYALRELEGRRPAQRSRA